MIAFSLSKEVEVGICEMRRQTEGAKKRQWSEWRKVFVNLRGGVWQANSGWHHTMRVCELCDGAYCSKCRRGDWLLQPCVSAPCTMEEP